LGTCQESFHHPGTNTNDVPYPVLSTYIYIYVHIVDDIDAHVQAAARGNSTLHLLIISYYIQLYIYVYINAHVQAAARRVAEGLEVDPEALEKEAQAAIGGNLLKHKELRGTAWSILVLCFTAVLREGLESFVFLGM
jgi:hypothetical protein